MTHLLEQSAILLEQTPTQFRRFLHEKIRWKNRLIGVTGARGTGKTTLLLQWLKSLDKSPAEAAYFSLDDLYFTTNSLQDTIDSFYKQGGKYLILDEVHKYPNWSAHIKWAHDFRKDLQIVFTGSSIIDIHRQQADLSRRALMYQLPGLSYREFLAFKYQIEISQLDLDTLLTNGHAIRKNMPETFRPLAYFQEYLRSGYYPFFMEDEASLPQRLKQMIRSIVENDLSALPEFDIRNAQKLLQLLYIVAQQVPFKPNLVSLAEKTSIHRNTLNGYLYYLDQAHLIKLLLPAGNSVATLQKPEKIYLQNTNLLYALAEQQVELGNLRETFFLSQVNAMHKVQLPKKGDFLVNDTYTFEVGGKGKTQKQIVGLKNAWIVKDNLEYPIGKEIPLWMFGLLY